MEVEWGSEFEKALKRAGGAAEQGGVAEERYDQLLGLLRALANLGAKPVQESPRFKRVRQARRHELWRVAHRYNPRVSVRVIVWFPSKERTVIALFAFDKAKLGGIWYDRATRESEAILDRWQRDHPSRMEER